MKKVILVLFLLLAGGIGFMFGRSYVYSRMDDPVWICTMVQKLSNDVIQRVDRLDKSALEPYQLDELRYMRQQAQRFSKISSSYLAIHNTNGNASQDNLHLLNQIEVPEYHILPSDIGYINTGRWSSAAICDNKSFFCITLPDRRKAYTRDGDFFYFATDGIMRTKDGYPLNPQVTGMPEGAQDPCITESGSVQYTDPSSNAIMDVGQISLYRFPEPSKLQVYSKTLLLATAAAGPVEQGEPGQNGFGHLISQHLEANGLSFITELATLQQYQHYLRVLDNAETFSFTDLLRNLLP